MSEMEDKQIDMFFPREVTVRREAEAKIWGFLYGVGFTVVVAAIVYLFGVKTY